MKKFLVLFTFCLVQMAYAQEQRSNANKPAARTKKSYSPSRTGASPRGESSVRRNVDTRRRPVQKVKPSESSRREDFTAPPATTVTPVVNEIVEPTPKPSFTDAQRSNRHRIEVPPKSDAKWWFGPRLAFWQESIKASRNGVKTTFPSQFIGVKASASRRGKIGKSVRWLYSFGFDAGFGTVKSSSSNPNFTDRLKNQPWYGLTVNPGLVYRGTAVTDIYLSAPVMLRQVMWTLSDSTLSMGPQQTYSPGTTILTANRLSPSTTFLVGFTHFYQWNATEWSMGLDYSF